MLLPGMRHARRARRELAGLSVWREMRGTHSLVIMMICALLMAETRATSCGTCQTLLLM